MDGEASILETLLGGLMAILFVLSPVLVSLALTGSVMLYARACDGRRGTGLRWGFFFAALWTPLYLLGIAALIVGSEWFHQDGMAWYLNLGLWFAGALIPAAILGSGLSIWRVRERRSLAVLAGLFNLVASAVTAWVLAMAALIMPQAG